jgi:hypothetical protein
MLMLSNHRTVLCTSFFIVRWAVAEEVLVGLTKYKLALQFSLIRVLLLLLAKTWLFQKMVTFLEGA